MQPHPDEPALVARARTGDHEAFTQLYEHYSPAIYRYLLSRTGQAEQAEDLRSDVFLRALEHIGQYEDRGWPFSSWLYRLAHDRLIDARRHEGFLRQTELREQVAVCTGAEEAVEVRLDLETLLRGTPELSDDQRAVLLLRFQADLSHDEIARRLGRTLTSVRVLQHRGLNLLAQHLTLDA